jgi:CheY-specific phosphatase CheX
MEVSAKETLVGTASRVFEQAAFMFADVVDSLDCEPTVGVSLSYDGDNSGSIELWTVRELALTIADNLLGESDSLSEEQLESRVSDALKETLNMIAGNLITDLYGTAPVYNLDIPAIIENPLNLQQIPDSAVRLRVEGFPVLLLMRISGSK